MRIDDIHDGKRHVLRYNFGTIRPGSDAYFDFLNAVIEDYLERVHHIRMALLDLPTDMRNWEQIEARQLDAAFAERIDETIGEDPLSPIFRRTVLVTGKDKNVMRVVDLVRS